MWLVRYVIVMGKVNSTYLHPNEALIKDPEVYSIQVRVVTHGLWFCLHKSDRIVTFETE